jgi:hypothetical protein
LLKIFAEIGEQLYTDFILRQTVQILPFCRSNVSGQTVQVRRNTHAMWENGDLVFTNQLGGHLAHFTVYKHFKR